MGSLTKKKKKDGIEVQKRAEKKRESDQKALSGSGFCGLNLSFM